MAPLHSPPGGAPGASAAAPLTLAAVSADTVRPGASLFIDGTGFAGASASAAGTASVAVTLAGVPVTVHAATTTRLELRIPEASVFPCLAAAPAALRVSVTRNGRRETAERTLVLAVARRIALGRGASLNLLESGAAQCTEFVAPAGETARYTLAVLNTERATSMTTGFRLRAESVGGVAPHAVGATTAMPPAATPIGDSPLHGAHANPFGAQGGGAFAAGAQARSSQARSAQAHSEPGEHPHDDRLGREREMVASLGPVRVSSGAAPSAGAAAATRASVALPPVVGQLVQRSAMYRSCEPTGQINARVVYVGAHSIVLEDVASPSAGTMDAQYRALGEEFDAVQYPLLVEHFGNPLALDAPLGGDGRVTMLFSPYVNQAAAGVAGYVSACNLYPRSQIAGSNQDELLYARVPHAGESAANWLRGMRSTVMHEGKHLAAFAERLSRNLPLEEAWLEEATARVAEELYARTFQAAGATRWKGNTGWSASVECELYQCDGRPLVMWKHFPALHDYLAGADTLTPLGRTGTQDVTWYASGWSLVRWAVDHFAATESGFLRELVLSREGGMAALEARTGTAAESLLAEWALANAVDDRPGFVPERSTLTFPSWNVPQIMAGLADFIGPRYSAQPLRLHDISGNAQVSVPQLRGFAAHYLETVVTDGASQVVELRDANGGAMPASIGLAIVRVQ